MPVSNLVRLQRDSVKVAVVFRRPYRQTRSQRTGKLQYVNWLVLLLQLSIVVQIVLCECSTLHSSALEFV